MAMRKLEEKSKWWIVDGEIHEIGDHVPPRERFVIPRDNIPSKRRKQLRDQFMRRTRLVLKETEHEPWCKRYMELYQELRENWERLYWDEGYSKKIAQDHANYESAGDDDHDFSPYRSKRFHPEPYKDNGFGSRQGDTWERINQIRDKFEYDSESSHRLTLIHPVIVAARELTSYHKAPSDSEISISCKLKKILRRTNLHYGAKTSFAPMSGEAPSNFHDMNSPRQPDLHDMNFRRQPNFHDMNSRRQPFDAQRYFSDSERE